MKIAALSDLHGRSELPDIQEGTNVVCIAGDMIPLRMQTNILQSQKWFREVFLQWAKNLKADMVILVPGNHDYLFERFNKSVFDKDIEEAGLENKVKFLVDSETEYNGFRFYGTPWIEVLWQWAFYTNEPSKIFGRIPVDCDILISHMPPTVGGVGTSYPNTDHEEPYGSMALEEALKERQVKLVFCGHIHTGTHNGVDLTTNSGEVTKVYNVSMIDERYQPAYPVTYVEI